MPRKTRAQIDAAALSKFPDQQPATNARETWPTLRAYLNQLIADLPNLDDEFGSGNGTTINFDKKFSFIRQGDGTAVNASAFTIALGDDAIGGNEVVIRHQAASAPTFTGVTVEDSGGFYVPNQVNEIRLVLLERGNGTTIPTRISRSFSLGSQLPIPSIANSQYMLVWDSVLGRWVPASGVNNPGFGGVLAYRTPSGQWTIREGGKFATLFKPTTQSGDLSATIAADQNSAYLVVDIRDANVTLDVSSLLTIPGGLLEVLILNPNRNASRTATFSAGAGVFGYYGDDSAVGTLSGFASSFVVSQDRANFSIVAHTFAGGNRLWVNNQSASVTLADYARIKKDRGDYADFAAVQAISNPTVGDWATVAAAGKLYLYSGSAWVDAGTSLGSIASNSILGNNTESAAIPAALTADQVRALLGFNFTGGNTGEVLTRQADGIYSPAPVGAGSDPEKTWQTVTFANPLVFNYNNGANIILNLSGNTELFKANIANLPSTGANIRIRATVTSAGARLFVDPDKARTVPDPQATDEFPPSLGVGKVVEVNITYDNSTGVDVVYSPLTTKTPVTAPTYNSITYSGTAEVGSILSASGVFSGVNENLTGTGSQVAHVRFPTLTDAQNLTNGTVVFTEPVGNGLPSEYTLVSGDINGHFRARFSPRSTTAPTSGPDVWGATIIGPVANAVVNTTRTRIVTGTGANNTASSTPFTISENVTISGMGGGAANTRGNVVINMEHGSGFIATSVTGVSLNGVALTRIHRNQRNSGNIESVDVFDIPRVNIPADGSVPLVITVNGTPLVIQYVIELISNTDSTVATNAIQFNEDDYVDGESVSFPSLTVTGAGLLVAYGTSGNAGCIWSPSNGQTVVENVNFAAANLSATRHIGSLVVSGAGSIASAYAKGAGSAAMNGSALQIFYRRN